MADGTNWRDVIRDAQATGAALQPRVEVVEDKFDARGQYFTVTRFDDKGSCQVITCRPDRIRRYVANGTSSLVSLVKAFCRRKSDGRSDPKPSLPPGHETALPKISSKFVFVDRDAIVALLDEADGHERVTFELERTEQYEAVCALEGGPLTQRDIIDLLRRRINGEYEPDLLPELRKLKFNKSDAGDSTVESGKSSMSRTVLAEIKGTDTLPDSFTITVPMFSNVRSSDGTPYHVQIECCLDVDLLQERFIVRPKAGEIARVEELVLDMIRGDLEAEFLDVELVSVFLGSPEDGND